MTQRSRIAVATIAVGPTARCGLVGWCQGAARLRVALSADISVDTLIIKPVSKNSTDAAGIAAAQGQSQALNEPLCKGARLMSVSPQLNSAAHKCMRTTAPGHHGAVIWLYKLQLFLASQYDAIFYVDLDADPMAPWLDSAAVAALWREQLKMFLSSRRKLVGVISDYTVPFHGGLFVVRPSEDIYTYMLTLLSECRFNKSHGWGLQGPPSSLVEQAYHVDGSRAHHW